MKRIRRIQFVLFRRLRFIRVPSFVNAITERRSSTRHPKKIFPCRAPWFRMRPSSKRPAPSRQSEAPTRAPTHESASRSSADAPALLKLEMLSSSKSFNYRGAFIRVKRSRLARATAGANETDLVPASEAHAVSKRKWRSTIASATGCWSVAETIADVPHAACLGFILLHANSAVHRGLTVNHTKESDHVRMDGDDLHGRR